MTNHEQRWDRLAELITERMQYLALSQADLARFSGVSVFTVRKLMRGEPGNYRPANLAKVERALHWLPTSIKAVLAGGDPRLGPDPIDALQRALTTGRGGELAAIEERLARLERAGPIWDAVVKNIEKSIPGGESQMVTIQFAGGEPEVVSATDAMTIFVKLLQVAGVTPTEASDMMREAADDIERKVEELRDDELVSRGQAPTLDASAAREGVVDDDLDEALLAEMAETERLVSGRARPSEPGRGASRSDR